MDSMDPPAAKAYARPRVGAGRIGAVLALLKPPGMPRPPGGR